jgi:hypothetical protein
MKALIFLILLLVSFSLCTQSTTNQDAKEQAVFSYLKTCKDNLQNLDYKNGPCLSDSNPSWNITDWVCDIAHSPRQSVDDLAENQCLAFREGKAHHFVEVDTDCNLIKVFE